MNHLDESSWTQNAGSAISETNAEGNVDQFEGGAICRERGPSEPKGVFSFLNRRSHAKSVPSAEPISVFGSDSSQIAHEREETMTLDKVDASTAAHLREIVTETFDPSHPARDRHSLSGRNRSVAELLAGILFRNNHAAICGPRGSGKTSLARVFADYADEHGVVVIYQAISDGTGFHDLLAPYLTQIPEECCQAGAKERVASEVSGGRLNPTTACELLSLVKYSRVVFVMDEFDRLEDRVTKAQVATLMKMMSDARLKVQFLVVGIGETARELISSHGSLTRHLTISPVEPLAAPALRSIVGRCLEDCGLKIENGALAQLVTAAYGSPYHIRLLGMHAALAAISRQSRMIQEIDASKGMQAAYSEWRACNPTDARVFETVIQSYPEELASLVQFSATAAVRHAGSIGFEDDTPSEAFSEFMKCRFFSALQRVLSVNPDTGEINFNDSTAPQFLAIVARAATAQSDSPTFRMGLRS